MRLGIPSNADAQKTLRRCLVFAQIVIAAGSNQQEMTMTSRSLKTLIEEKPLTLESTVLPSRHAPARERISLSPVISLTLLATGRFWGKAVAHAQQHLAPDKE